jgi:hypothetical protein
MFQTNITTKSLLFNATLIGNVTKKATVDAPSATNRSGNKMPKRTMRLGTAVMIFKTVINRQVALTASDVKHFAKDNYTRVSIEFFVSRM